MKKENNLKVVCGTLAGMIIGGLAVVGANQAIQAIQNTEIKVNLNGQVQSFKDETTGETQYPITYNDRTYLPLRNVAQLSGLSVDYDASSNTAILDNNIINEIISVACDTIKYPLMMENGQYNNAVKTTVKKISIFDRDYMNTIVYGYDNYVLQHEGVKGQIQAPPEYYDFFKSVLSRNSSSTSRIPVYGIITFMIEYEKDTEGGEWAGSGPNFKNGKYAIGTREFVYENGKLVTNTGGTFSTQNTYSYDDMVEMLQKSVEGGTVLDIDKDGYPEIIKFGVAIAGEEPLSAYTTNETGLVSQLSVKNNILDNTFIVYDTEDGVYAYNNQDDGPEYNSCIYKLIINGSELEVKEVLKDIEWDVEDNIPEEGYYVDGIKVEKSVYDKKIEELNNIKVNNKFYYREKENVGNALEYENLWN